MSNYTRKKVNISGNYRGRTRGKNLIKVSGGVINQYGVFFSHDDRRKLESRVNTATAKRRRMLKNEAEMQLFSGGEKQPAKVGDLVGYESDFILQRKSKSLQKFTSYQEYENYIKNLERINRRDYISWRVSEYQNNYIKAMEHQGFPKETIDKIKNLNPNEFMKLAQQEEKIKFGYVYSHEHRQSVIDGINAGVDRIKG